MQTERRFLVKVESLPGAQRYFKVQQNVAGQPQGLEGRGASESESNPESRGSGMSDLRGLGQFTEMHPVSSGSGEQLNGRPKEQVDRP